ncbi:MAG: ABC-F family ATP-binding cassette domain-containing protein [Ignavibacteria bacterium]|jgi:ATP-binding cassette subfamily F protein 3
MIDLIDLAIQYSGRYLFENVNLRINKEDKIALVGANGSGKSTLLKLLNGIESPEFGRINYPKNISIGYLPQEFINQSRDQLFEEVKASVKIINEITKEEDKLHSQLSDENLTHETKNSILEKLGELQHKKDDINYYETDSIIESVLMGLGFTVNDFKRKTNEFSGGWQMRIELAKILLGEHNLILLDEPTNHLDIDSLQWLIEYFKKYNGALLIVSHDRFFINNVTSKTIEIFNNKVSFYNGNYESFLNYKKERDEQLIASFKNQQRKIKQTERFIERFRYKNTKAKQVQSRVKQLEKIDKIELPEFESEIKIRFPEAERSGVIPVSIENLSMSYDDKKFVFTNLDFQIERGDKIAFVGPNGAGKTTLSKIIAHKLNHTAGQVKIGHNTQISYYAQEVADDLNLDKNIIEVLSEVSTNYTENQLRTLMGSFLFHEDDVFKKVKVLSGGEKSRVALAKILLTKANMIVLDEPTNHLDYNSKLVLQDALINFNGSLIIVSHDIDFMKPVINKVFEIRVDSKKMFLGGIDYYLSQKQEQLEEKIEKNDGSNNSERVTKKDRKRIEAEQRQKKYKATKELKAKIEEYELKIAKLENQKNILENELGKEEVFSNPALSKEKNQQYENIKTKLEETYSVWTELTAELEDIENSFE